MPSRWADTAEDAVETERRKAEKEEKKRRKAQKLKEQEAQAAIATDHHDEPPTKRRRLSIDDATSTPAIIPEPELRTTPRWQACRSVKQFQHLNPIEEGSYGFVSRAKELSTGEIVALKRLKMDRLRDGGFPVTSLREIQCLSIAKHRHVVNLREVVTGEGDSVGDVYLVMEFLEHDLKSLQEDMLDPFTASEVKTLMLQLGSAVEFLHENWILHRDLKTSNILMNNRGELKVADFGMARFYGDPAPRNLTQLVVTLWYRSPELLLGTKEYDTSIDMWSVGCIFGELLSKAPLLQGKNEVDQLTKIFELCGTPTRETWPDFKRLPNARHLRLPDKPSHGGNPLRTKFLLLTKAGASLLAELLQLNPEHRPSARNMLSHPYFSEDPRPKATAMFPTFPSKAGQEKRRKHFSPHAPVRGDAPQLGELDYSTVFK